MSTALKRSLAAPAMLALSVLGDPAGAADIVPAPEPPSGGSVNQRVERAWEFTVAPYFVAANIVGTSQVGRLPRTDLDVSTGDIIENLHFGGMIHTEAMYRQTLGAIVDVSYMKLGAATDIIRTGGRARVGVKQLIAEAMITYRAFKHERSYVDLIAGGRYWDVTLDLNVTGSVVGSFTTERGDSWWDPVIGVRGFHRINDRWSANLRADIGGFGLGSDFSWNVQGGVGYHFNDTWSAVLNYKALSVDYDNDRSGTGSFEYDAVTHGPVIGVVARF